MPRRLPRAFYLQSTRTVARQLIGKNLTLRRNGRLQHFMIVETEAYLGIDDRACHSFGGRRTPRVEVMYRVGGHAYVYFIYGMYFCLNVVTRGEGCPEAILIRAVADPDDPTSRRYAGPGKLCRALAITRAQNGADLVRPGPLTITEAKQTSAKKPHRLVATTRVGVDSYGEAALYKLRFYMQDHPAVSVQSLRK